MLDLSSNIAPNRKMDRSGVPGMSIDYAELITNLAIWPF